MDAWANLCRCCLSPNSQVSLLDASEQNANVKFFEVTTIKVKEDDGLPQNLCSDCFSVLNSAYQFRKQCIKMDKELKVQLNIIETPDKDVSSDATMESQEIQNNINKSDDPMKVLEDFIKAEPISDDDFYYVLVVDDAKDQKKETSEKDQSVDVKIEPPCDITPCKNEDPEDEEDRQENESNDFDSINSYLISNSKVPDSVPDTILENEEDSQENDEAQGMDYEETMDTSQEQITPHIIETNGIIDTDKSPHEITINNIVEQLPKNSNLIKILTTSGDERTIMLKGDDAIKYLTNPQYVSMEDGESVTQEEVIFCEGDDTSQYQILKCEGSELVIEYADDSEITTVLQQEDGTFVCDCGETFEHLADYEKHQHKHNPAGEHLCNLCGKGFESSEILIGHMLLHSVSSPFVTCPFCNQLIRRNSLTQHIKYGHTNKPQCNICQKTFANQNNLKRHMMIHNDVKEFECDICYKRFLQKITMQVHKLTHVNSFACKPCDKIFDSKEASLAHRESNECSQNKISKAKEELMRTVKQEITTNVGKVLGYACSLCKRMFSVESALEQHIESKHLVDNSAGVEKPKRTRSATARRFECSICGKICASHAMLVMHERVHTNERPFPCQLCPLRFKTKTHLNTHQLTHTREKKFGCSVCMKFFALKGNLVVHLRTHTGERPYVCSLCDEAFIDSKYLKKHKLKKHAIDNVPYNQY